jgi:hypothetical protein
VTLEILGGVLVLPVLAADSPYPAPEFAPGGLAPEGEADGVTWRFEHDVLTRTTSAVIDHGGDYPTAYGRFREHYTGRVDVDRRTFAQRATARVTFGLDLAATRIEVASDLEVVADAESFTVTIDLDAAEEGQPSRHRSWHQVFPRDLA